tara:strand:- start:4679 stop:4810 length:132 start_codon:yes stop_codon:yes gene_type:complete
MIYIQLEDVAHPIRFEEATTANCDAVCVLASFAVREIGGMTAA